MTDKLAETILAAIEDVYDMDVTHADYAKAAAAAHNRNHIAKMAGWV